MHDASLLAALETSLSREGLFVVRAVTPAALAAQGVRLALGDLLAGARSALVIGDGGGDFFARFVHSGMSGAHPLDRYTVQVVPAAVLRALGGQRRPFAVRYPFDRRDPLPMQQIGMAAGLPPPGPLGIQIHPRFGPWWAYRALVVLDAELPPQEPLPSPCWSCPAPCVAACPGRAVAVGGLLVERCVSHRLAGPECAGSCAARAACIAGPQHRYPPEQLAFHMSHSLGMIRRYRDGQSVP